MKNQIFMSVMIVILVVITDHATADTKSAAYLKAVETGDYSAAYDAQSYLTPIYCYDLNKCHGVKFLKAVNGRAFSPAFTFVYQDMKHLKVRQLRERIGIDDFIQKSHNDLELIMKICNWANMQWGHMQPLPYPTFDAIEILDRSEKGDAFWCTYKTALFVQACNAAGLTARMLNINPENDFGHTPSEVYNNDFRKWMLVDPWLNCYYEWDGVPLSAREIHNAIGHPDGIFLVFGENGRFMEYWDVQAGKTDTIPHANARIPLEKDPGNGLLDLYFHIMFPLRNDYTVHPLSKENIFIDGFMVPYDAQGGDWWNPMLHWVDDRTPPIVTFENTGRIDDFEWPLNEVRVDLKKISVPGEPVVLETRFTTCTPNFSRYLLEIDDSEVPIDGDVYLWKLRKGKNSLKITSINDPGRRGFPSEFVLEYDPSLFDYSRIVAVKIENTGFEGVDAEKKPVNWTTITSNPFMYGEFEADSKVKHSGACSLKATPARNPKSNLEYPFIVHCTPFDVNPSRDIMYSIWLRASADDTPVDIALIDASNKVQGGYSECVMVDRQWKKFELKCCLLNELIRVYVGFKVYTGTVWADDVGFEEFQ